MIMRRLAQLFFFVRRASVCVIQLINRSIQSDSFKTVSTIGRLPADRVSVFKVFSSMRPYAFVCVCVRMRVYVVCVRLRLRPYAFVCVCVRLRSSASVFVCVCLRSSALFNSSRHSAN